MLKSMTAFSSGTGETATFSWSWELRSVNAKGLDLRLRVPDWIDGLEMGLRTRLTKAMGRGSVALSLKLSREDQGGSLAVNASVLNSVLEGMHAIEEAALAKGVSLTPASAAEVLAMRGVAETRSADEDTAGLREALLTDFQPILERFLDMRASEGAALHQVLGGQIDKIATLTAEAAEVVVSRAEENEQALRNALARVIQNIGEADEQRVTQELALIAVKSDVTEELDRLRAHIDAARELMAQDGPVGRKLDFLMQEFNREANTLCSKSQNTQLTRVGLELKTVIDQMREQVQNVE
ncbi:YicC/YloC family endoribonuclease [Thalassovita sp.]|uniref:YicC/YloC family endoribonuclease n=1 Tax=Thalassovita sp. TaxID=1979401 RepID=UPI003B5AA3AD